jgi:hypothetical protein
MTTQLFPQTTIAIIWDFDKTLIPGYMQDPLFEHYGVDGREFWREVNGLPAFHTGHGLELVSPDTLYLNHILTYVREGIFKGLSNQLLRTLGSKLAFYEGLPALFPRLKQIVTENLVFSKHEITVEHYIVSTGLRQMILGSSIAEHVDFVWGCEFVEQVAPSGYLHGPGNAAPGLRQIADIGYVIDNTTKTRAVFEINKGTNKWPEITVNHQIAHEDRRIPFQNMIYVADGPSDIPVFSILNQYGGRTFAVYKPGTPSEFTQVKSLDDQARIQAFGAADYREGTQTYMWLTTSIDEIATAIVEVREDALGGRLGAPPRHLVDRPPLPPGDLAVGEATLPTPSAGSPEVDGPQGQEAQ